MNTTSPVKRTCGHFWRCREGRNPTGIGGGMGAMLRLDGYTPKWVLQRLLGQFGFSFLNATIRPFGLPLVSMWRAAQNSSGRRPTLSRAATYADHFRNFCAIPKRLGQISGSRVLEAGYMRAAAPRLEEMERRP